MPLLLDRGLTEYVDYPVHLDRLQWLWNQIEAVRRPGETIDVLDIGCGTGNITIPLGMIADSQIQGIDIHQPTLDIASGRNRLANVTFALMALQDCDLAPFDILIMTEVLEHIGPYPEVLRYLADNMKPGARLLVTVPNGRGPFEISQTPVYMLRKMGLDRFINRIKGFLGKREPYSQNYETPHINFFTLPRLRRELLDLGLSIHGLKHSFVTLPIIETYLPFIKMGSSLVRTDNLWAQNLPSSMVSGWYLDIRKHLAS